MFKKVTLFVVLMMLIVGTVHASSFNGDYKGNPIVKVTSNGKQIETDEVPAMIYDGHTVVPISLLRQLGASVTWNGNTYTVDVALNKGRIDLEQLGKASKDHNTSFVNYATSGDGKSVLTYYYNKKYAEIESGDLFFFWSSCIQTDAYLCRVYYSDSATLSVFASDARDYFDKKLTSDQFAKTYIVVFPNQSSGSVQSPPVSTVQPTQPAQPVTPSTIKSKIVDTFEGFNEGNLYELDNGQIWKQKDYKYTYTYKYRPSVLIYKDGASYYLKVDGVDGEVKVERIK